MSIRLSLILAVAVVSSSIANAQTVITEFNTSDGFVTGPINGAAPAAGAFAPVTVTNGGFDVTFSGGQQLQSFDGPSYSGGPAAFFFINTGPGAATFTGSFGNTVTGGANNGDSNGSIAFSGLGASSVSFFAADRANGTSSTFDVLDIFGNTISANNAIGDGAVGAAANQITLSESVLGSAIGAINFDLAGPNANPPYVVAIDSFSATASTTAAVPEPSALMVMLGSLAVAGLRRRR